MKNSPKDAIIRIAAFAPSAGAIRKGGGEEEILRDYMLTYRNFYGVTEESEVYRPVGESNLLHSLASAFGLSSLDRADLAACAEEYLRGIGPGGAEIAALKENLSKNYPAPQA